MKDPHGFSPHPSAGPEAPSFRGGVDDGYMVSCPEFFWRTPRRMDVREGTPGYRSLPGFEWPDRGGGSSKDSHGGARDGPWNGPPARQMGPPTVGLLAGRPGSLGWLGTSGRPRPPARPNGPLSKACFCASASGPQCHNGAFLTAASFGLAFHHPFCFGR